MNFRTSLLLALAALALSACPDRVVPVEVTLLKPSDSGSGPDPLQDVTHLRFRVLNSDGLVVEHLGQKMEKVATRESRSAAFEQLPSGTPMRLQVAGFNGPPEDKQMVSFGLSAPFTVPEEKTDGMAAVKVRVFLRAVERFSPVVRADDPTRKAVLSEPRAGHTATLLADGRVLIAGGFEGTGIDPLSWRFKDTVEIFDPATGTVSTKAPPMMYKYNSTARAFHTATRLADGTVLIAGGEAASPPEKPTTLLAQIGAILFDPTIDGVGGWAESIALKKPRSRHTAEVGSDGQVLLVGGVDWNQSGGTYVDAFEWYDPTAKVFKAQEDPGVFARTGHGIAAFNSGRYVAVAGGGVRRYDAATSKYLDPALGEGRDAMRFFQWDFSQGKFTPFPDNYTAQDIAGFVPRSWPAVAMLGKSRMVILGGFRGFDPAKPHELFMADPYSYSDVIWVKSVIKREVGPQIGLARGHMCAVTLKDGRVLAVGGRGGPSARPESVTDAVLLAESGDAVAADTKADPLAQARQFHTCTLLDDGSVLVVGGVVETFGQPLVTLDSMEIFVPKPVEE